MNNVTIDSGPGKQGAAITKMTTTPKWTFAPILHQGFATTKPLKRHSAEIRCKKDRLRDSRNRVAQQNSIFCPHLHQRTRGYSWLCHLLRAMVAVE